MKIDFLDLLALAGAGALLSGLYLFDWRWVLVGGGALVLMGIVLFGKRP